ncbi:GIY-YIG nuclease family protein [Paraburkholderia terrae]|uniref:GIY-YIG nuclease family protein n=1 Tax=Paraburkholderia terrae TaxID=311230 RepID=UPI0005A92A5B|nr:GIY-YIG nuclease family protein [Paraburkholderia terrae]
MEKQTVAEEGYVYVLGVKDIDLPVSKIGRTTRDPAVRCAEINQSSTGDFIWEVTHQIAVSDCRKLELLVHEKLSPLRQKRREFFNIYPDAAIRAIESILASASDLRMVTLNEIRMEDPRVSERTIVPRRQITRSGKDTIYAHLLDGFTELLNVKGRPFGQLNKPTFGISDGHEGVQWNLKIRPDDQTARVGVNLEGLAYRGWPIAALIKSELGTPVLPRLVPQLRDRQNITLRFARDAWQATARPSILEENLGGREFHLPELTGDLWHTILTEALGCLNKERNYLGRARQTVTLVRKAGLEPESRIMEVSPHLTIWTPVDPSRDSVDELSSAIERLLPIHDWASKASGA